jgi:RNA polymerase sigma-70 factor (sigma-E family)
MRSSEIDASFTRFVAARGGLMRRSAAYLCAGDEADADDLLQATLVRAFASWSRIRDPATTDAYVRRIMVRLSYKRAQARRRPMDAVPDRITEQGPIERVDDRLMLLDALARLSARQRAVVVLRYYEGLTENEIADALGCAPGTVKSHASRALNALRPLLETTEIQRS